MSETVDIERVDHIGIRVRDLDRALAFYRVLGFTLARRATGDDVAIVRNPQGVEINLIFNADAGEPAENILMDIGRNIRVIRMSRCALPRSRKRSLRSPQTGSRLRRGRCRWARPGTFRFSSAIPTATSSSCAAATRVRSPA